ncbi:hypothetical protein FNJ62_01995 [Streptomyces benahoarensis]|uniref:Uncharacterized protein n=1 Tax=Streptomyces benahoarensis TaxID=2595054 RepID=A0A553ZR76_9ACTN|nr:hypothetical protein FNJ62_01995 [Streptomyces benahoarensis]TSB43978.1 hypothetical protein FNZ23_01395 [Streptomyces benahoarensis]
MLVPRRRRRAARPAAPPVAPAPPYKRRRRTAPVSLGNRGRIPRVRIAGDTEPVARSDAYSVGRRRRLRVEKTHAPAGVGSTPPGGHTVRGIRHVERSPDSG